MASDSRRLIDPSAAVVAALAAAPLVAVTAPFGPGLWLQGAAILALLALRFMPRAPHLAQALAAAPRPVRAGLLLYTGAAFWGAAVGLASGNPVSHVIAQSVSMLLLPIGFLAFATPPPLTPPALLQGLGLASGLAVVAHLAALAAPGTLGPPEGEAFRLILRNDIGFGGLGALGVVLGTGWRRGGGGRAATGTVAAGAVLLVGAMSRGAWIAAAAGLVAVLALTSGAGHCSQRAPWPSRPDLSWWSPRESGVRSCCCAPATRCRRPASYLRPSRIYASRPRIERPAPSPVAS